MTESTISSRALNLQLQNEESRSFILRTRAQHGLIHSSYYECMLLEFLLSAWIIFAELYRGSRTVTHTALTVTYISGLFSEATDKCKSAASVFVPLFLLPLQDVFSLWKGGTTKHLIRNLFQTKVCSMFNWEFFSSNSYQCLEYQIPGPWLESYVERTTQKTSDYTKTGLDFNDKACLLKCRALTGCPNPLLPV